jgi:hypothetical protein
VANWSGHDNVIGKGPTEKAGKNVDDVVKDLKK